MAVQLASFLVPKGGNSFFLLEDIYFRGGLRLVPTTAERDTLHSSTRKAGMLVITQSDNKIWQLDADLQTWKEFQVGGGSAVRQTAMHLVENIPIDGSTDFALPLGRTALIHKLSVDTPCIVEAFETPMRDDSNPYKFVATSDHLEDDGSSLMTDGTVLRGRRYAILTNQEPGPSMDIYFRITNTDVVAKNVNLTVSFLPLETVG